jgi:hypothetical protein
MDLRPASFKMHIVHAGFYQLDAAALFRGGVRRGAVADYLFKIEPFSLIRHDDRYLLAGLAAAAHVYFSFRVFLIAVHDGVFQCLPERQLDIRLFARNALGPLNPPHQPANQR